MDFCEEKQKLACCRDTFLTRGLMVWGDSHGTNGDKELWYVTSEGPIGGLWWQSPVCLLINASSFGFLFPTLFVSKSFWRGIFGVYVSDLNQALQSPHEYLICVGAITHLTSPLCPLVGDAGVFLCAAVQAGAAGVPYREGSHPEVFRSVSLSNCSSYVQGRQAWWDPTPIFFFLAQSILQWNKSLQQL